MAPTKRISLNDFTADDMLELFIHLVNEMDDLTLERSLDELGADMREILRSTLARFDGEN